MKKQAKYRILERIHAHTYSRVFSTFVESAELSAKITLKVFYRAKGLSKFLEVDDTVMMLFIAQ